MFDNLLLIFYLCFFSDNLSLLNQLIQLIFKSFQCITRRRLYFWIRHNFLYGASGSFNSHTMLFSEFCYGFFETGF